MFKKYRLTKGDYILAGVIVVLAIGLLGMAVTRLLSVGGSQHLSSELLSNGSQARRPEEILAKAQTAFDAKQYGEAIAILEAGFGNIYSSIRSNPAAFEMQKRASDKIFESLAPERAADFKQLVSERYLPQIAALPVSAPSDLAEVWAREKILGDLARELVTASKLPLDAEQRATWIQMKVALAQKQPSVLAAIRRGFAAQLREKLWLNDIRAGVAGADATKLQFTGAIFAANTNIKTAQDVYSSPTRKLRFKQIEYRWHQGSDGTAYLIEPPSDREIGYWEGDSFVAVPLE